jgi:hypothetical protein
MICGTRAAITSVVCLPGLADVGDVDAALLRNFVDVGLRDIGEAGFLEEALDGGVGRALLRADDVFGDVCRFDGQTFNHRNKTPGAGEALDSLGDEAGRGEAIHQRFHEIGLGLRLHAGRDFFREDFEQKLGHGPWCGALFVATGFGAEFAASVQRNGRNCKLRKGAEGSS